VRILTDDDVNLTAGDNAEDVVAGRGNQQSRQQADPRQNMRSGNNYYGADNHNGDQIWLQAQITDHTNQLREHAGKILELRLMIDNLPNRFIRLKDTVDIQVEKIKELENLEVVVRKDDVVVRPITPPDSVTLPTRTLLIMLVIAFIVLVAVVSYLVYLQAVING